MFSLIISENILFYISGFGVLQAIFLTALLIFYPKSDRSVNIFLAAYLSTLSLPMIIPVIPRLFSWQVFIFLEPMLALLAPFLYFYILSFKEVVTWKKALPHLIFFFISIILAGWVYLAVGSKYPATEEVPPEVKKNILFFTPFTLRLVQRIIYYFLSRRELISYQRSIQHLFSDTSRINLNWVKWLINGFLFLIIVTIVFYWLVLKYPDNFNLWLLGTGVIVTIYIYIAAFKGITQLTLWQMQSDSSKSILEVELKNAERIEVQQGEAQNIKQQKSVLTEDKTQEIISRLIKTLEEEKLYQEPDLTLQHLAERLQFPSYQVSQAINEGMKKSFYDLVNGYRVEEAKRLLLDSKNSNHTILSVGFEAGFNSKTTFNTVFKKFTGLTPTEFREKKKGVYLQT